MTTYPLSEPATIRRTAEDGIGNGASDADEIVARGSRLECPKILEAWSPADLASAQIELDDMGLQYGNERYRQNLYAADFLSG